MTTSDDRRPAAEAGRADGDGGDVYEAAGRTYVLAVNPSRPLDETWAQDLANDHALRAAIDAARAPLLAELAEYERNVEELNTKTIREIKRLGRELAEVTRERDEARAEIERLARAVGRVREIRDDWKSAGTRIADRVRLDVILDQLERSRG